MRTASALTAAVAVCALAGLGLAVVIDRSHHRPAHQERALPRDAGPTGGMPEARTTGRTGPVSEHAALNHDASADRRHRLYVVSLIAYGLLAFGVLAALLRYVAKPVRRLVVAAEDARELAHGFRPIGRGPSEIRQLSQTVGHLIGDLERRVGERTEQLAGQASALTLEVRRRRRVELALREAVTESEAVSDAKSAFLSVMSHELRTPMNAILGTLTLLRDTRLSGRQRMYVETARESGQALTALLNNMLELSEIETGRLELATREVDLIALLDQTLDQFHPVCCQKRVVLAGRVAPDVPRRVLGDAARIRQILSNLVGNAARFTDHGHVRVRIETSLGSHGGRALTFSVEDSGPGIAQEDQARILADFPRSAVPVTRSRAGAGLGLAICGRLVRAMGGTIGLTSEPGIGSTFSFAVPLAAPEITENGLEQRLRESLLQTDLVVAGDCPELVAALRHTFEGWVASLVLATDPATLAEVAAGAGPRSACIVGGDPATPAWARLIAALGDRRFGRGVIAVIPHGVGAAETSADDAGFEATIRGALRPGVLMGAVGGADPPAQRGGKALEPGRGHVLLVDDSAANRMIAASILERAGFSVSIADNGLAAVQIAGRIRPDIILMDIRMPLMDGYEAARAIRALPGRAREVPILAVSAELAVESEAERRGLRFDGYLAKPVSPPDLLQAVVATIGRPEPTRGVSGMDRADGTERENT